MITTFLTQANVTEKKCSPILIWCHRPSTVLPDVAFSHPAVSLDCHSCFQAEVKPEVTWTSIPT